MKLVEGLSEETPSIVYIFGTKVFYEETFVASLMWGDRARKEVIGGITSYIAAEIDVLVNHIAESEEWRLLAYLSEMEIEPTEQQLKKALTDVFDIYRPPFEELKDRPFDPLSNTELVWRCLFDRQIDVWNEIIRPSIRAREKAFGY